MIAFLLQISSQKQSIFSSLTQSLTRSRNKKKMMKTEVESIWLLAIASKCESITPFNTFIFASLFLLSCIFLHLIFWAHPGGSAWGTHKWTRPKPKTSTPPIPGPKGLPVIGSMGLMSGLAHHKTAQAAQSHGAQRLMALSLGQTRVVVTCDPEIARDILNSSTFSDRPAKESAYRLMFTRSIGFAPYGVYWAALRRIAAAHLFCPKQIKASESQRLEIANQVVGVLGRDRTAGVRVRDVLKMASLNNMMWSVFGRRYDVGSADAEMAELMDLVDEGYDLLGQMNWADHVPWLAQFDFQKIRFRCGRIVPRVNRFVGGIIGERKKAACKGGGGSDFVDLLLSLEGADRLSDSDMIAVLWEMIFRGTDTVAVLIEWILARLVSHPDVQSKVHNELDEVVGRSRAVAESDLTDLVYLTAVVKEVLRLHPPGPLLSWSRLSIRDSVVDGYHVPAGTTAMVNMWAIMRDPNVWDDPLAFDPNRFLRPTEYSVLGSDLRIAPFGSGRRSCPGKTLGMSTVNFWVATLLHEFEFVGCGESVDLSEVLKLSCEMANPLEVAVRPRRSRN